MIRLLDTREQKSPRFLMDAFPDLQITVMESGDYFSGKMEVPFNSPEPFNQLLTGNLVEIKIGSDFGIHTEPLERFQDELYRMSCYRQKNPHVQLHAVWVTMGDETFAASRVFFNLCFKYHVWGHILWGNSSLITLLKDLDQPSSYKEFEPYIKRSHEEPTILAKMLRQFPGISSQKAIDINRALLDEGFGGLNIFRNGELEPLALYSIIETIGRKKDTSPKKLGMQLSHWLETGETR